MQVESRPFTEEERKSLQNVASNWRKQRRGEKYFGFFIPFVGLMVIFVVLSKIFPTLKFYQGYYMLVAGLISLILAYKWHEATRRAYDYDTGEVDSNLKNGMAEVCTFDVTGAVEVKEFEDEGSHYYLDIGEGKVLFLSGQYLYEYEDAKQFPNTRFQTIRAAKSRWIFGLKLLGNYLSPVFTLPAFSKADYEKGVIPCDGDVLELDFDTLKRKRSAT